MITIKQIAELCGVSRGTVDRVINGRGKVKEEKRALILRHLDMLIETKGSHIGPREMRKHATWYTRGMKNSARLRELFNRAETREDFSSILEKLA